MLRALVRSVQRFRESGRVPDLIFATGDIGYSGKGDQYEIATQFFNDLLAAAGLDRRHLFLVPGNHDVDRTRGVGLARTLESREEADAYFGPDVHLHHLTSKQCAFLRWYNRYFDGITIYTQGFELRSSGCHRNPGWKDWHLAYQQRRVLSG